MRAFGPRTERCGKSDLRRTAVTGQNQHRTVAGKHGGGHVEAANVGRQPLAHRQSGNHQRLADAGVRRNAGQFTDHHGARLHLAQPCTPLHHRREQRQAGDPARIRLHLAHRESRTQPDPDKHHRTHARHPPQGVAGIGKSCLQRLQSPDVGSVRDRVTRPGLVVAQHRIAATRQPVGKDAQGATGAERLVAPGFADDDADIPVRRMQLREGASQAKRANRRQGRSR